VKSVKIEGWLHARFLLLAEMLRIKIFPPQAGPAKLKKELVTIINRIAKEEDKLRLIAKLVDALK
jgi:hypothetical protein